MLYADCLGDCDEHGVVPINILSSFLFAIKTEDNVFLAPKVRWGHRLIQVSGL